MRRTLAIAGWILMMALLCAGQGEVIDRIVATVNGTAILESEWDAAVRYECFVDQRPLPSLTAADLKATLERLIDQTLIQQQMRAAKFTSPAADESGQRLQELRQQVQQAITAQHAGESWRQALESYGLSEEEFSTRATLQVETLRFVDLRFRPRVHVDQRRVESYYREKLLPELQRSGAKGATLAEASPKIEELLVQQSMDEMLTAWLRNLRAQSEVELR